MVEPRLVSGLTMGLGINRSKIAAGSKGSAVVGEKIVICLERLYGSPTVIVWSQGMYSSRAKTIMGCEFYGSFAVERLQAVQ